MHAQKLFACRRPAPLQPADTIAAIAPSGRFAHDHFAAGHAVLQRAGLQLARYADLVPSFMYAGSQPARQQQLQEALSTDAAALWAIRGGSGGGAMMALPGVVQAVQDVLSTRARWLVGFSDITALHLVWQAAGCMSIHGANLTTLSKWSEEARTELFALLGANPPTQQFFGTPLLNGDAHGPGCATGMLVGGNLTVLASAAGTGLIPDWQGCIVLLEDIGERPYRLDRALAQLIAAGHFRGVRGVILGQLTDCDDVQADFSTEQLLAARLEDLNVPVLSGVAIGHNDDSRAVMLGAPARLDLDKSELSVAP